MHTYLFFHAFMNSACSGEQNCNSGLRFLVYYNNIYLNFANVTQGHVIYSDIIILEKFRMWLILVKWLILWVKM